MNLSTDIFLEARNSAGGRLSAKELRYCLFTCFALDLNVFDIDRFTIPLTSVFI